MSDHSGVGIHAETYYEAESSGIAYFTEPKPDDTLESFADITYKPINSLSNHGPIRFEIGGRDFKLYTQLSTLLVEGVINITHLDNTAVVEGEKLSIVNTFIHSLFDYISLKINGIPVSDHAR